MDKQDIIADLALKDLAKKEKLKAIIHQPAHRIFLKGGIRGILSSAIGLALFIYLLIKEIVPAWGFLVSALALISTLVSLRNYERLDALIELQDLENKK